MKRLFLLSLFALFISVITTTSANANENVSDQRISEITQRLETYSTDSLVERRDFLASYQDGDVQEDANGVPVGSASERAIEISVIEALLVALGVVMIDNVTEDSVSYTHLTLPTIFRV